MVLYNRPQLIVLLLVVVTAGVGLGVSQWRRAYPELSERLERFDRTPADVATEAPQPASPSPAQLNRDAPARPVDVNRASEDDLRTLPGVGAVLAARIVEARERDGPFASLDDLRRVRGLGRAKLERLATAIALSP